jgi:hypothetical protein
MKRIKIALCLQGLSQGANDKGDLVPYEEGCPTIKEKILDINDVDVFMHSWGTNEKHIESLKDLYSPIYSIFENQISFPPPENISLPPPQSENEYNPQRKYHYVSSRWYSHQQSLNLKRRYEDENKFKYDFVMVSRFDCTYFTPFNFESYDPQYFYASDDHGEPDKGFNDVWFFSNSEAMDKFSTVYDNLDFYMKETQGQSSHEISRAHVVAIGLEDKIRYVKKLPVDYQLSRRVL